MKPLFKLFFSIDILHHYESSTFTTDTSVELFSTYRNEGVEFEIDESELDESDDESDDETDLSDVLQLRGAKIPKLQSMYATRLLIQNYISLHTFTIAWLEWNMAIFP